jgi:hypothetical protein
VSRQIAAIDPVVANWSSFDGAANDWDDALASLGGDIYQSHAWGEYRGATGWRVLRAISTDEGHDIVAMAQILVRRRLGATIIWIPGAAAGDCRRWAVSLPRFLRRRLGSATYCRVNILSERLPNVENTLTAGGWSRPGVRLGTGLSLELDLRPSMQERLKLASVNWRHNLRRSGKYGLTIEPWPQPDARQMAAIYRGMEDYKGLGQQHSEADLQAMIDNLGERLLVFRCLDSEGDLLAFRAAAVFGGRGWDLLASATGPARKVYASHAVLWALLEACQKQGAHTYDLGGVDPLSNKGVFDFKRGTGARTIEYMGEWEWASVPLLAPMVGLMMKYRGLVAG